MKKLVFLLFWYCVRRIFGRFIEGSVNMFFIKFKMIIVIMCLWIFCRYGKKNCNLCRFVFKFGCVGFFFGGEFGLLVGFGDILWFCFLWFFFDFFLVIFLLLVVKLGCLLFFLDVVVIGLCLLLVIENLGKGNVLRDEFIEMNFGLCDVWIRKRNVELWLIVIWCFC